MLEVASVILGFISILQNVKNKKKLEEKVNEIRMALREVGSIYELLLSAKTTHDEYEKFESIALDPFMIVYENKDTSMESLKEELENFIKTTQKLLKNLDVTHEEVINIIDISAEEVIPNSIRINIDKIQRVYPKYIKALNFFNQQFIEIQDFPRTRDFGDNFDHCIVRMEDSAKDSRASADELIFNIAPLIDYVYVEVKKALDNIL